MPRIYTCVLISSGKTFARNNCICIFQKISPVTWFRRKIPILILLAVELCRMLTEIGALSFRSQPSPGDCLLGGQDVTVAIGCGQCPLEGGWLQFPLLRQISTGAEVAFPSRLRYRPLLCAGRWCRGGSTLWISVTPYLPPLCPSAKIDHPRSL